MGGNSNQIWPSLQTKIDENDSIQTAILITEMIDIPEKRSPKSQMRPL